MQRTREVAHAVRADMLVVWHDLHLGGGCQERRTRPSRVLRGQPDGDGKVVDHAAEGDRQQPAEFHQLVRPAAGAGRWVLDPELQSGPPLGSGRRIGDGQLRLLVRREHSPIDIDRLPVHLRGRKVRRHGERGRLLAGQPRRRRFLGGQALRCEQRALPARLPLGPALRRVLLRHHHDLAVRKIVAPERALVLQRLLLV